MPTVQKMLTALVISFALFLATAGASHAQGQISNATPVTSNGVIEGALRAADAYWTRMGFTVAAPAVTYLYDDSDTDAQARAFLNQPEMGITRRALRSAWLGFWAKFCTTITHERGHALGLDHDSGWPIMRHDTDGTRFQPLECWKWSADVRAWVKAARARARAVTRLDGTDPKRRKRAQRRVDRAAA